MSIHFDLDGEALSLTTAFNAVDIAPFVPDSANLWRELTIGTGMGTAIFDISNAFPPGQPPISYYIKYRNISAAGQTLYLGTGMPTTTTADSYPLYPGEEAMWPWSQAPGFVTSDAAGGKIRIAILKEL